MSSHCGKLPFRCLSLIHISNIVPEYNRCEVVPGDLLLLCTDGLTNMVPDAELALLLQESAFFEMCIRDSVLTQTAAPADPDTLWADVEQVAQQAVAACVSMRAVEGEKLRTDEMCIRDSCC